jgi:hypothetical protein
MVGENDEGGERMSEFEKLEEAVRKRYPKAVFSSEGRWHLDIDHDGRQLTVRWQDAGYGVFQITDLDSKTVDRVITHEVAYAIVCQELGEP